MAYDYYEFGVDGGNLMRGSPDNSDLARLDKVTGRWVEDNYLITYLYGGDSEMLTDDEAKALAEKLCPGQDVSLD